MKHFTRLAGVALSAIMAFGAAAEAKELRLGTITPDNTIWTIWAKQVQGFVAKVAELSGGDLANSYFGNAQLGTMADTMKMTLTGRLDMWMGAVPALAAVVPEMSLLSLPYIFESPNIASADAPRAVREYLDTLDEAAFGAASEVQPKFTSHSDPASQCLSADCYAIACR